MGIVLEQVPIEAAGFTPFMALGEFLAHEQKFFARVGILVGVKQAEIGELLPQVAGHFVEERILSVDDFVVREGKKEIFGEGVEEREGQFVMFVLAMDGIVREIFQGVVHPAHVPFKTEAEAAEVGGAGDGRPGGGFFGDGKCAGEFLMGHFVHALEEFDGVQVFAATELVGDPFAGFAGVVEIKHRSHCVHAKAVDVVFVEPEERIRDQIVLNFVAAVVVDECAPIRMRALAGIGMFVEMGAVELGEAVGVAGKMRGRPIEKDAEAGLVAAIDKFHEFGGGAVAAGGGEIAESLITPGAVEGMLHDGEEFDMRVAEVFDVGDELVGEFAIGEPAVVSFGDAPPGAEMDFVDGDRRLEPVFLDAPGEPIGIVPFVVIEAGDDGAGVGAKFGTEGVGIGFKRQDVSGGADDFIFVDGAFGKLGEKDFPDAGSAAGPHGMDATVPTVEITYDTDALGAGGPDGKVNAADAFEGDDVGTEFFVSVVVAAFAHEVEIEFGEHGRKSVGVVEFERDAVMRAALDFVAAGSRSRCLI